MKPRSQHFVRIFVLTSTICAMGASVQNQSAPAIPSVTTPAKNAKPTVQPRKVVDSVAFRAAVAEARKAMDSGDFIAAEKAYAQAIVADSSNSRAQFNQGVAQYKSQNLQGSSESFAAAGQIGDPTVAEGAMFNQGDAAYSGAIKIIDSDDFKEPVGASAQDQENTKRKEAIDAAIEAATRALTHFKDAASADQLDIDARFNAEAATRLLKMLEEEKKKEEEKKGQDKKDQEKKEEDKKDEGDKGDPKDEQSKDGQPKDEGQQEKDKQGKDGKKDEGDKGDQQEGKNLDKSEEKKEEKKPDESKDGKEEAPKPEEKGKKQAEGQKPGEETQGQESQGQESKAGEPVKDAPLTKQEADRLLQAVRDREKTRKEDREAKELAKPTRRTPASKDW